MLYYRIDDGYMNKMNNRIDPLTYKSQLRNVSRDKMYNLKSLFTSLALLFIIGLLSSSLAFSPLINSVTINSGGRIVARIQFDNCDQIDSWKFTNPNQNTLEIYTLDKVEGTASLKGTFAAYGSVFGGMFYKNPGSSWDFTDTPLMRIWVRLDALIPDLKFELVTGEIGKPSAWNSFVYEILDQIVVGKWCEVTIDLRRPDSGPVGKLPVLNLSKQISFFTWSSISSPVSLNWDDITVASGPYVPPRVAISPLNSSIIQGESVTFHLCVLGGEEPYSYSWYVNGTLQQETSSSFTFTSLTTGVFNVTCRINDNRDNGSYASAFVTVLAPPPEHPPYPESFISFQSEVRGVSVAYVWGSNYNHTEIAETLYQYGINTVWVDVELPYFISESEWNGSMQFRDLTYHRVFIDECHKRGMRVIASLVTMMHAPTSPTSLWTLTSTGEVEWLDITKPLARQLLFAIIQELATKYSFDGINLDYIRWDDRSDMPLGNEARDKFIADTGLSDVNWPSDVLSGGRYYWQFMNWRANVITELVGELYRTAKEANPNIVVSISPWEALGDAPWYWVLHIGQHAADMVDKGYCDFVSPMCYDENASRVIQETQWAYDLYVGSREGKYPLIPWLAHRYFTPQEFANLMTQLKSIGIDGWILNPYGGPGAEGIGYPDIRPYLAALYDAGLMEPVWAIQNFQVVANLTHATISWTTTVPTNATIEYANGTIFYSTTSLYQGALYYKDINYNETDPVKITNSTYSTAHSFTISITEITRLRIQCADKNGKILTSKEYLISEFS